MIESEDLERQAKDGNPNNQNNQNQDKGVHKKFHSTFANFKKMGLRELSEKEKELDQEVAKEVESANANEDPDSQLKLADFENRLHLFDHL